MPDSSDWKQKYRDSVLEMETEESRWRQVEQVLRRLIGRLCAAAMGVDPQLDDELVALAAANRRNADAAELERLDAATRTANQVRTAVEALRFHFRGTPVRVTVSCGLTELQAQDTAEAAFDRADAALYHAKHGGRNLCVAALLPSVVPASKIRKSH